MSYWTQEMTEKKSLGLTPMNARGQLRFERDQLERLERHAFALCRETAQGRGAGTIPVTLNEDGNWEVISILDCPQAFTPCQIAQWRELGEAMVRTLNRDRTLAKLVAHYVSTRPEHDYPRTSIHRWKAESGLLN